MPGRDGPGTGPATRRGGWLSGLVMLGGLLVVRSAWRWLRDGHSRRAPRVSREAVEAGHETRDVPIVPVVVGISAVLVGIGAALVVATWFQATRVARPLTLNPPPGLATPAPPPSPPEPRLEEAPGDQLRQYRAAQQRLLNDASWIDRQAGIARIPIDRAIDLVTEHPLPARPAAEASPEAAGPPTDASSGRVPRGAAP
jgi:hypothetical protein